MLPKLLNLDMIMTNIGSSQIISEDMCSVCLELWRCEICEN